MGSFFSCLVNWLCCRSQQRQQKQQIKNGPISGNKEIGWAKTYQMEDMGEQAVNIKDIKPSILPQDFDANTDVSNIEIPEDDNYNENVKKEINKRMLELSSISVGEGANGIVYIAYQLDKQYSRDLMADHLACKVMDLKVKVNRNKTIISKKRKEDFISELSLMVRLSKHPNIVKILDYCIIGHKCYLFMDLAERGSLDSERKRHAPYEESVAKQYFSQITSAIYYLHCALGIAHLDIKLGNILVFNKQSPFDTNCKVTLKVTDFGLSRLRIDSNGIMKEFDPRGTVPFMSPQVLLLYIKEKLDEESLFGEQRPFNPFIADIWALGVCLYILLFNDYPFGYEKDPRLMKNVLDDMKRKSYLDILRKKENDLQKTSNRQKNKRNKELSRECMDLIEDCIEPNPHKRLPIYDVACHVWFDNTYTIEQITSPVYLSSID
ncbi:uncharacterized protein LOC128962451 [Oppia nitens]|uniref:uncharacterized protein LOC128962451 n=1 Tax=Oppia nitens TaxID=1686743 RepID=UPI0023DBA4EF|nr:uncharacterized protein LOC128962451 [Oppia nitens]